MPTLQRRPDEKATVLYLRLRQTGNEARYVNTPSTERQSTKTVLRGEQARPKPA
jgi:hypothetical protein